MQEIDDWANSAKAAVIHKNAFSAGCGYSDYSGWLLSALGVSKAKDETTGGKGVYTTEGNSFNDAYTNDNICCKERLLSRTNSNHSLSICVTTFRMTEKPVEEITPDSLI